MPGITRFEDLIVWQKARRLAYDVHRLSAGGRLAHDYALVDQMRRSAVSVVSNIAEGFERKRATSFRLFLEYARGSCAELRAQLNLAADAGWLTRDQHQHLAELAEEVGRLLGALHRTQEQRKRM